MLWSVLNIVFVLSGSGPEEWVDLKINNDKTEVIKFVSTQQPSKITLDGFNVCDIVRAQDVAKNLGGTLEFPND